MTTRQLIADGTPLSSPTTTSRVLGPRTTLIEIGPGAGADGGRVIFHGPIEEPRAPATGPYMAGLRR